MINSPSLNGLNIQDAKNKIIENMNVDAFLTQEDGTVQEHPFTDYLQKNYLFGFY